MSSPIRPPLWITETDGNPSGRPINKIIVSNGTLTINGTTATITTGGSGGSGTVTNVSSTDSFISISNPNTTPSITIQDATTSQDGILTSTDWNTFNNKTANAGTVTSVGSSQAFVTVASATTTPSISIGSASGSATGVLTSTDWTTFNNKGSGDGTIGGSIANTQVAVGSGTNTISGGNSLLFDGSSLTVNTGSNDPTINLSSSSKAVTLKVATSQKLTIQGSSDTFVFDASSSSGGITFPDGTTQITAASGGISWSTPVDSNIIPATDDAYDIGSLTTQFKNAYFDGTVRTDNLTVDASASVFTNITLGGGSYSTPSYAFIDDPDCGMGREDTNAIFLGTGGNPRLKIYSDGAIDLVDSKLKIANSYGSDGQVLTSTGSGVAWENAGGGGGGISWSTPVDSTLTPDTTATYDIGTSSALFRKAYFSSDVTTGSLNISGNITRPNGSLQITAGGSQSSRAHIFLPNNETNMKINGSSSSKTDIILDTRWNDASNTATIQLKTKGQTRFQVGADGELKVGSNAGDSGQVLTSGGAGAVPTWEDAGGGSGTVTVGTNAGNNNLAYFSGATEISNTNNISINAAAGSADFFGQIESSKFVVASGGAGVTFSDGTTQTTAASGGSSIWNQTNTKNNINSSYRRFVVSRLAPWGQYGTGTTTIGAVDTPHCRPFISPVSGDVTEIGINVTTADATATTKLSIGIYSDSNGAPDSLLALGVMNSTSTGSSFQTSFSGTATLVAGTQYWYMWVRNNSTNAIGFTAMSNTHLVWVGASSTVSAGMNQQAVLSLSGSNNTLPATVTQSNLTPSFYGSIELGLKIV